MVNYLGFTLIKLPNNQRYNKMTILKLFHKKKSTICLLVVPPEIRAWAPRRRKKYNFLSFCGSPFSKDPTNPCPGFSSEFINYYHRFYKPPPPLPFPPYRLQFSAGLHLFRIIIFRSLHFRNITYKDMICIFMQFICQIC